MEGGREVEKQRGGNFVTGNRKFLDVARRSPISCSPARSSNAPTEYLDGNDISTPKIYNTLTIAFSRGCMALVDHISEWLHWESNMVISSVIRYDEDGKGTRGTYLPVAYILMSAVGENCFEGTCCISLWKV